MDSNDIKLLKEIEDENTRLKKLFADDPSPISVPG